MNFLILGDVFSEPSQGGPILTFGQGFESSIGAGYGLEKVPGMEGWDNARPERYFDDSNDKRRGSTTEIYDATKKVLFYSPFFILFYFLFSL